MDGSRSGATRISVQKYCILLLLLAFVVRCGAVLGLRDIHTSHGRGPAGADAVEFNAIGLHLASGGGYAIQPGHPTSFRSPGFPLFLAVLYRFSYENYALVYLSLCGIGAVTCLLTYLSARLIVAEWTARAAGLLASLYVPHIYFSTIFLSELLFSLCVGGALWLFLMHLKHSAVWLLVGAGALLGYAALTRPVAVLFLPALGLLLTRSRDRTWIRAARHCTVLAFCACLVVAPWALRNYRVHRRVVLFTTNGGSTFYGANNDTVLHNLAYLGS